MQFDLAAGLAKENFGHNLALPCLDHDPVAAPHLLGGRNDNAITLAIERLHGVALHFECVNAAFARSGKGNLVPALACRKPGAVEEATGAGLSKPQQRHGLDGARAPDLQESAARPEGVKAFPGCIENLGQAFGGGPALATILADAFGYVERSGIEAGEFSQC